MKKFTKIISTLLLMVTCLALTFSIGCGEPEPQKEIAVLTSSNSVSMVEYSYTDATFVFDLKGDVITDVTGNNITSSDWQISDGTLTIKQSYVSKNCSSHGEYTFSVTSENGLTETIIITITKKQIPPEPSVDGSTDNKDPEGPWLDA